MAKRRASSFARTKMPLESAMGRASGATSGTSYGDEIDLDLLQDEVAEIWKIDAEIALGGPSPDVEENEIASAILSLNPDVPLATSPETLAEDLETFFYHSFERATSIIAAPTNTIRSVQVANHKMSDFNIKPLLVGTNIGMNARFISTTANALTWTVRVYFTRRKATVMELNQILLKRR